MTRRPMVVSGARELGVPASPSGHSGSAPSPKGLGHSESVPNAALEVLQGLSFSLSVGGLDETDPAKLQARIDDGIQMLLAPWERDARRYQRLRGIGAAPGGTLHLRDGNVLVSTNLDAWIDSYIERGIPPAPAHAVEYKPPYAPAPEQGAALNYVADMTYCGVDAEWHFKSGYDPQVVLDAIAKARGAQ
jgi:hypothetical protein